MPLHVDHPGHPRFGTPRPADAREGDVESHKRQIGNRRREGSVVATKSWRDHPDKAEVLGFRIGRYYTRTSGQEQMYDWSSSTNPTRLSIFSCGGLLVRGQKVYVGVVERHADIFIASGGAITILPDLRIPGKRGAPRLNPLRYHRDTSEAMLDHQAKLRAWAEALVDKVALSLSSDPSTAGQLTLNRAYRGIVRSFVKAVVADHVKHGEPMTETDFARRLFGGGLSEPDAKRRLYPYAPSVRHALLLTSALYLAPRATARDGMAGLSGIDLLKLAFLAQIGIPGFPSDEALATLILEAQNCLGRVHPLLELRKHRTDWTVHGSVEEALDRHLGTWLANRKTLLQGLVEKLPGSSRP